MPDCIGGGGECIWPKPMWWALAARWAWLGDDCECAAIGCGETAAPSEPVDELDADADVDENPLEVGVCGPTVGNGLRGVASDADPVDGLIVNANWFACV